MVYGRSLGHGFDGQCFNFVSTSLNERFFPRGKNNDEKGDFSASPRSSPRGKMVFGLLNAGEGAFEIAGAKWIVGVQEQKKF